ncbi:MAG: hypothetical protein JJE46_04000 [Acidimicrobiia bacterium]|nr:hypothetical protein [Acidimicrobiia bacterium]
MSRFRARHGRAISLAVLAVCLGACSVDATVTVRMRENGSGAVAVHVALDRGAVTAAEVGGGQLEQRVRLDDLPDAGWTVSPWRHTKSGGATLVVRKPFDRPEQVAGIVQELSGPDGPLQKFEAAREVSTFSTKWRVSGSVDLRAPRLGIGADQQLVANLTAERVDVPQVEADLVGKLDGLRVHAVAELPDGERREVSTTVGKQAALAADGESTDVGRVALLVGGLAVGVLALIVLVVGERRTRRSGRRRARNVTRPRNV